MSGDITPLPNTPPWRGAQLKRKAQRQLYLHLYSFSSLSTTFKHLRLQVIQNEELEERDTNTYFLCVLCIKSIR
jgi:hypothetical protein